MAYRSYVPKMYTTWMCVMIYTVRSLKANDACPNTPNTKENTSITCICSLHSTQTTQIGFVQIQDSEENCKSTLTMEEQTTSVSFLCRSSGSKTLTRNIDSKGYLLRLKADSAPVRSTFCINFWNTGGSGSLRVQCYSQTGSTTKATIISSTTSSGQETSTTIGIESLETTNSTSRSVTSVMFSAKSSKTVTSATTQTTDDVAGKFAAEKEKQGFPVAAVGGAAGAVVLVTVVVILIVVLVKRNRGQKTNQQSEIDYYTIYPDTRAPKNNETNKRPEEIVTDVELIRNDLYYKENSVKSVNCPSDDYATVEDEATTIESKSNEDNVSKALKSKHGNRNDYDNVEGETSLDDNAGMYAKVNKNKKGKTDKKTGEENVTAQSDLYAVVDKTKKKNKLPAKTAPSGDVYTLVQKPDKSKEKDAANISGDIYTEVKKPKKKEKNISEDEVSGNI